MHPYKHAYSVGELLRNRAGEDRWHLALVQRSEVWDVDRMRQLLDSLLMRYPVGALLLCRTRLDSKVIMRDGDETVVVDARADEWQLLDGQQRLNALYTMLSDDPEKHELRALLPRPCDAPGLHGLCCRWTVEHQVSAMAPGRAWRLGAGPLRRLPRTRPLPCAIQLV